MSEYRAYMLGDDGSIISFRAFSCPNDGDAIIWAKQLVDGHGIEPWSGEQLIVRLVLQPK
jgi:hypothetical protein